MNVLNGWLMRPIPALAKASTTMAKVDLWHARLAVKTLRRDQREAIAGRRQRPALGFLSQGRLPPPRAAQISWYCERSSRTEADSVLLPRRPASIRVACSMPWASR